jgi:hypothetical protein
LDPVLAEVRRQYVSYLNGGNKVSVEMRAFFRLLWWRTEGALSETERSGRNNMIEAIRFTNSVLSKHINSFRRDADLSHTYRESFQYQQLVVQVAKLMVQLVNLFPEHFRKMTELRKLYGKGDDRAMNPFVIDILQTTLYSLKLNPDGADLQQITERRMLFAEDVVKVALGLSKIQDGQQLELKPDQAEDVLHVLKLGLKTYNEEEVARVLR